MDEAKVDITVPKAPLKRGERHPAANIALEYLKETLTPEKAHAYLTKFREDTELISCTYALEHLLNGKIISDVYLIGLASVIKVIEDLRENV